VVVIAFKLAFGRCNLFTNFSNPLAKQVDGITQTFRPVAIFFDF